MKKDRLQTLGEEIANSITHGLGALGGLAAGIVLIALTAQHKDFITVLALSTFVITVFTLYLISTLYHAMPNNRSKSVFRILDHSAIYLLIAGTYTPFALSVLQGRIGWMLFGLIWVVAIVGVVLKAISFKQIPWLSTVLYLGMGWVAVLVANPLIEKLPNDALIWLVIGGVVYSLGVIFFVLDERVKYAHFIWHIFVLVGTGCHFASLFLCTV